MGGTRAEKAAYFVKLRELIDNNRELPLLLFVRACREETRSSSFLSPSFSLDLPRERRQRWIQPEFVLHDSPSTFITTSLPFFPFSLSPVHQIRQSLRGKATILMGKNTMVRRALRTILAEYPQFEKLLPHVKGNIGFVFTAGDLKEVRENILANKVAAPARAGALAPVDVWVPAGNTGMEPGKTAFFQALSIPTKIARGTIEIVTDVQVVSAGTRVGTSEATLLNMMNVSLLSSCSLLPALFESLMLFSFVFTARRSLLSRTE